MGFKIVDKTGWNGFVNGGSTLQFLRITSYQKNINISRRANWDNGGKLYIAQLLKCAVGVDGFEPPTLPPLSGMRRTSYECFYSCFIFPAFDFSFSCISRFFTLKLFRINNLPIIVFTRKAFMIRIVFSQPLF